MNVKKISLGFLLLTVTAIFIVKMIKAPVAGQLPEPKDEFMSGIKIRVKEQVERMMKSHTIQPHTLKEGLWLSIHSGQVEMVQTILEKQAFNLEFADHGTIKAALERAKYLHNRGDEIGYYRFDDAMSGPKDYQFIPLEPELQEIIDILEKYIKQLHIAQ